MRRHTIRPTVFLIERRSMRTDLTAHPGDRLVIHPHRLGEPERDAEILEALGPDGTPPFRVQWSDTGDVTLHFPGVDARVDHLTERKGEDARAVAERG
jgi:hypothetical protein